MTEIIEHPLISCAGIVIDNGETHYKNGSTIIKLSENTKPQLLREGAIKINPEEL
jgi:tRNA A37 threonylcarbamoyladenosine synthetase subunit TsaC/SUA5/YrdC